jgi:hypothetical protein
LKLPAVSPLAAHIGAAVLRRVRQAVPRVSAAVLALLLAGAVLARPYGACMMAQEMAQQAPGASDGCAHQGQMPGPAGHTGHMCCLCCGPACCGCAPPPAVQTPVALAPAHTIEIAAPAGGELLPRAATPFRQPPPIGPPASSASVRVSSVAS